MSAFTSREAVEAATAEVLTLLRRHHVLSTLASRQQTTKRDLLEEMQRRENLVDLRKRLRGLHPADLASIVESLPIADRPEVWRQLAPDTAGLVLVEMTQETRETLIGDLDQDELVAALETLDADDLSYLSETLPADLMAAISQRLAAQERSRLIDSQSFEEGTVGRLMSFDVAWIGDGGTVGDALRTLRSAAELPEQTDRLFVVDARHILAGAIPLQVLIRANESESLRTLMTTDVAAFRPGDPAARAAHAFERYDLVSAPVVDHLGKLLGRVTIDTVVDYLRASSDMGTLTRAGLRGAEDLFATVSESVRNRWPWLCLNLITAFAASRVIGVFEGTIVQIAALATLMPIVASIGGNTGNQTMALVIRALALDQLRDGPAQLVRRELSVSLVNGAMWGLVVGVAAVLLYHNAALGAVMASAVILNLIVAAVAGIVVPLVLRWFDRDPANGASVILTFVTDSMGFFLFLGLARAFLV